MENMQISAMSQDIKKSTIFSPDFQGKHDYFHDQKVWKMMSHNFLNFIL